MKVKVDVKLDQAKLNKLVQAQKQALEMTATEVITDIVNSQVVPFEHGQLEKSHSVDSSGLNEGKVSIAVGGGDVPYARRLYWHPEYNFRTDKNPNAQGKWMQTYIDGEKKNYAKEKFMEFLKALSGELIK